MYVIEGAQREPAPDFNVTARATEASLSGHSETCCSGTEPSVYAGLTMIAAVLLIAAGAIYKVKPDWLDDKDDLAPFVLIPASPYLVVCGSFWIACEAQDETQEGAFSVTLCILAILSCLYCCGCVGCRLYFGRLWWRLGGFTCWYFVLPPVILTDKL